MRIISTLAFVTLLTTGCSKKDPVAELGKHADKVCAAADYKTARAAWRASLDYLSANNESKEMQEYERQISTAIIDHGAVKQATGVAAKLLECAEKTGAY